MRKDEGKVDGNEVTDRNFYDSSLLLGRLATRRVAWSRIR